MNSEATMSAGNLYFETAGALLQEIAAQEMDKITQVGKAAARSMMNGGILHLFGVGHSAIPAHELYIRAGSLTNARPVSLEYILDLFEQVNGVGTTLMRNFDGRPGEVLIVLSNSGVNPLPLEVALEAKKRQLFTVGICSFAHSGSVQPKHPSGQRLMDVVDVAIDTHVPAGDAGLELRGVPSKVCPLSNVAGITIVHAIAAETIEQIVAMGGTPPVRISRNLPGGAEHNQKYIEQYGERIPGLKL
jgi:uncharacterized phosphosugar-binding protein